ncbi:hypothetical protein FSP39_001536 [Pinctada imbricata]|uniref:RING-type E3 ubiquitin transferase n=1 Tax=Pinctada imbricata TaxID=66713 RepID=A0AA88YKK4_PINIB|nr:hypothetical protein FSP39_001536 [Pinctada imbricata]
MSDTPGFPSLQPPSLHGPASQVPLPGKPEFVNISERYLCLMCHQVLRNAVQTTCGHRLCEQCVNDEIERGVEGGAVVKCPGGEEDCVVLSPTEIKKDFSARREVRNLPVFCTFKKNGCTAITKWKELQVHETQCEFRDVSCPYHGEGCNVKIPLSDVDSHVTGCEYRPSTCQYCQGRIPNILIKDHQDSVCPAIPVTCPYGCQTAPLLRSELENHMITCDKRPRTCRFNNLGCTFKGSEQELKEHEKSNIDDHLEFVTVFAANMDLESMKLREEMQEMTMDNESTSSSIRQMNDHVSSMKKSIENFQREMADVKAKLLIRSERLDTMESKFGEFAARKDVEAIEREIVAFKTEQDTTMERINAYERAGSVAGAHPAVPEHILVKLREQGRLLGMQDIRLAELDLRFQILETASYDGVLVWKIKDYTRRKEDAISRRTLSLYSQPFYTSRYGYKMCARVYLNGDGMGKGTHMSLFFVILKGEYDALLPWPFKQKVTLMLLDQESGIRHLSDSFRPDPSSCSFRRPTTEMNVASGCPLFVSHAVLESNTYCKDDTLFIKVMIDREGLI